MSISEGLPEVLRHGPLLLVSPHPDDAALSCAALIERDEPLNILTVFTGTPESPRQGSWDRTTGFANSAQSMPKRLAEERATFRGTPHALEFLGALELQYVTDASRSTDAAVIVRAVSSWLDRCDGLVAIPAGAGSQVGRFRSRARSVLGRRIPARHPDHVFVRDTVLRAVARTRHRILLYEELPYLWGKPADDEVLHLAAEHDRVTTCLTVPVDRRAKVSRIATYRTQVPHLSAGSKRVDVAHDVPEEERYWLFV